MSDFSKTQRYNLKKPGQLFQAVIHFHPGCLQLNPLSGNIHKQILLTDAPTFSYCISWENLLKDINNLTLMIILLILVTFSAGYVLILLGEI